jgi:hypothetical protein
MRAAGDKGDKDKDDKYWRLQQTRDDCHLAEIAFHTELWPAGASPRFLALRLSRLSGEVTARRSSSQPAHAADRGSYTSLDR